MWIENNPEILGRMDENDNPITVEIDESYFFKRKLFNNMMIMIAELLR